MTLITSQCWTAVITLSKILLSPEKNIPRIPHSCLSWTMETFNLLYVCMILPILDNSYNWNYIIFILLCLVYFTYIVFKVHPYCSIYGKFIPFSGWIILVLYTTFYLSIHLLIDTWAASSVYKNAFLILFYSILLVFCFIFDFLLAHTYLLWGILGDFCCCLLSTF